jgi:hypothetical protein
MRAAATTTRLRADLPSATPVVRSDLAAHNHPKRGMVSRSRHGDA